ncbi:hypothetical protein GmRootV15_40580 [Variovorax sp. V15]
MLPTPSLSITRRLAGMLAIAGLATAFAGGATAAEVKFDTPLRIVVGYAPGGATDRVARIVATSSPPAWACPWWSTTSPAPAAASRRSR